MDEAGIERSVWAGLDLLRARQLLRRRRGGGASERFAGVFSVDMLAADAPQRIRHWLGRGLKGLRVFIAGHTTAQDARLDDPRSFPAWRCAVDAGIPICVQLRAPGLPQLETLLKEFPSARIVLDHMARPAPDDAASLFALARHPNLFLKFTTHNVRDAAKAGISPRTFLSQVVDAFGARRIAWGSNYPASEGSLGNCLRRGATRAPPCRLATRLDLRGPPKTFISVIFDFTYHGRLGVPSRSRCEQLNLPCSPRLPRVALKHYSGKACQRLKVPDATLVSWLEERADILPPKMLQVIDLLDAKGAARGFLALSLQPSLLR
jgi:hypothetical protein